MKPWSDVTSVRRLALNHQFRTGRSRILRLHLRWRSKGRQVTLAEILKLVHVVAVIVWVGGSFMLGFIFERAQRSSDEATVLGITKMAEFIGKAVFNPAGIITLLAGIWLVIEADYEFSEAWISIGFLGVALGAILGMTFYPKAFKAVEDGIEADGLLGNETLAALRKVRMVSTIEFLLLIVVVWAMVFKPGA